MPNPFSEFAGHVAETLSKDGGILRGMKEDAQSIWGENANVNRRLPNGESKDRRFRVKGEGRSETRERGAVMRGAMTYHDMFLGQESSTMGKAIGYGVPGILGVSMAGGAVHESNNGDTVGAAVLGTGAAAIGGALALAGFGRVAEAKIAGIARGVVKDSQVTGETLAQHAPKGQEAAERLPKETQVSHAPAPHPEAIPEGANIDNALSGSGAPHIPSDIGATSKGEHISVDEMHRFLIQDTHEFENYMYQFRNMARHHEIADDYHAKTQNDPGQKSDWEDLHDTVGDIVKSGGKLGAENADVASMVTASLDRHGYDAQVTPRDPEKHHTSDVPWANTQTLDIGWKKR